jgi:hypothetical protein
MEREDKLRCARHLVWDYAVKEAEILDVLEGRRERVAGFDRDALFSRMLQSSSWHVIVDIFGIEEVKRRLTPELIARLWPLALRERYGRVREILRGDPVSSAGWGTEDTRPGLRVALRARTFSHRWYRA